MSWLNAKTALSDLNPGPDQSNKPLFDGKLPKPAGSGWAATIQRFRFHRKLSATAEVTLALENLGTNTDPVTTDVSIMVS